MELVHRRRVHVPVGRQLFLVDREEMLGVVGERKLRQQIRFERVEFLGRELLVGRDPTAAIHRASAVGHLHVGRIPRRGVVPVVVIEERNVAVVALDQPPAGRVVLGRGQRQAGILDDRINRLDQPLAERVIAENPRAVVILQCAGDDLRSARRIAVDQYHDRIDRGRDCRYAQYKRAPRSCGLCAKR